MGRKANYGCVWLIEFLVLYMDAIPGGAIGHLKCQVLLFLVTSAG